MQSSIVSEAKAIENELIAHRRHLHQNPELGFDLPETTAYVMQQLREYGYEPKAVGKAGISAVVGPDGGKTFLIRGDMDALPMKEETGLPFSSINGKMHACGHDFHTSALLGAAKLLKVHESELKGQVKLMFQPAEEIGQGAKPFIAAGVLDGAERVFGLHTAHDLRSGTVGLKPGLNNAAVDHFRIEVHGKSTHVSTPHLGTDALYIASQIVVAVQGLVTRMTSPTEPVIIGIGCLNAGTTYNAVAEHAVMEGTTRTVSQESRDRIRRLVSETADSIAAIYGGTAEIVWTDFAAALINDAEVCREAAAVADSLLGEGHVVTDRELSLSGDNFAEFELYRPGAYAYLGTGNPDKPHTVVSNHNGGFDVDEDALVTGAALYAGYALARLG